MSIADITPSDSYTATASQTVFTVSFGFFTDESLDVYQTTSGVDFDVVDDKLVLNTDYTVTGAGNESGVTQEITLTTGATAGDTIIIVRNESYNRTSDYQTGGDLLADTLNNEQDKVIMLTQQIRDETGRAIQVDVNVDTDTFDSTLPDPTDSDNQGLYLRINADGSNIEAAALTSDLTDINLVDDVSPQLGGTLDTNSQQVRLSKGVDKVATTALALGTSGNLFDVSGTTTITSIDTLAVGTVVTLHFTDALTLTHNATTLILPGEGDITTASGDVFTFTEDSTGNWRCIAYLLASGEAVGGNGTAGEIPTWDSGGLPTEIPAGTAGYILESNGSGSTATFVKGQSPLDTQTASASSELDFDTGINSDFSIYEFEFSGLTFSDATTLNIRTSGDSGVVYDFGASAYSWVFAASQADDIVGTPNKYSDSSHSSIQINSSLFALSTTSTGSLNGTLRLYNPSSTSLYTYMSHSVVFQLTSSENTVLVEGSGKRIDASAVNAIRFFPTAGTILTGTITMRGIV